MNSGSGGESLSERTETGVWGPFRTGRKQAGFSRGQSVRRGGLPEEKRDGRILLCPGGIWKDWERTGSLGSGDLPVPRNIPFRCCSVWGDMGSDPVLCFRRIRTVGVRRTGRRCRGAAALRTGRTGCWMDEGTGGMESRPSGEGSGELKAV